MTFYHGKNFRVLVGPADLSSYFNEATSSFTADVAETTVFTDSGRTYIAGVTDNTLTLSGLYDGSPNAVEETLRSYLPSGLGEPLAVVTLCPSNYTVAGRKADVFEAVETSLEVAGAIGDVVSISSDLQGTGPARPGWLLTALAEETAAATGPSIDTGAAWVNGSAGFTANVHVTANARAGASTIAIETSADGATWVEIGTVAVPADADGFSYHFLDRDAPVERYVRAVQTGTGAMTYLVSFAHLGAPLAP